MVHVGKADGEALFNKRNHYYKLVDNNNKTSFDITRIFFLKERLTTLKVEIA